jgi:hypothetical protein
MSSNQVLDINPIEKSSDVSTPIVGDEKQLQQQKPQLKIPEKNSVYSEKSYWEQRFQVEESYDWLGKYSDFGHLLEKHIPQPSTSKVVIIGCGNSCLGAELIDHGFQDVTNTDFSVTVISKMKMKYASEAQGKYKSMQWQVMDMLYCDQSFDKDSVDVILDKGAADALLVKYEEEDIWNPSDTARDLVNRMNTGILAVLKPGGVYIQLSYQQPHFRKNIFLDKKHYPWTITVERYGLYYCYVMKKNSTHTHSS